MTKEEKREAKQASRFWALNKRGLCQHAKPMNEHCKECHSIYIEMTIEAMGDDYIGYGTRD